MQNFHILDKNIVKLYHYYKFQDFENKFISYSTMAHHVSRLCGTETTFDGSNVYGWNFSQTFGPLRLKFGQTYTDFASNFHSLILFWMTFFFLSAIQLTIISWILKTHEEKQLQSQYSTGSLQLLQL